MPTPTLLAASAAVLLALGATAARAGEVTVTVTGAKAGGGKVLIALQTEGQFAKPAGAYAAAVEPNGGRAIHSFSGVKPGRYAVAVVQDTDKNGAVTLGKTGPTEPWGLSGPVQPGAPKFAPAAVKVTADPLMLTIPLTSR